MRLVPLDHIPWYKVYLVLSLKESPRMALTISQVANAADVNVQTIRYYERRGLFPTPRRTPAGYRQYADDAVAPPLHQARPGARFLVAGDPGAARAARPARRRMRCRRAENQK